MPSRDLFVVLQLRCPHRALISLKSTLPIPPVAPTLVQRHRAYCDKPDESLCFERNGIGKSDEMPAELMGHAYLKNVTFETNTSQMLHKELFNYLNDQDRIKITWSCSPKLSVSGESWEDAIKPEVAFNYQSVCDSDIYFKFVVATQDDFAEVEKAVDSYRSAGVQCPVYLMPLGGRSEEYVLNVKQVAEACMEKGWRFTPRLHISLFGNAWGT